MGEVKCIYCGKGTSDGVEISESDIIPDGLTNAKIRCKNVCKTEHNNKFSDLFESKIINELAFLRNHLNIKGKGNKFPSYDVNIKIQDELYKTKAVNDATLVGSKKIPSIDKSVLIGPIEEIKKMKNAEEKIKAIDLNSTPIEKQVIINQEVFISNEIYRLVAKIAYEWFCKINNIMNKHSCFNDIINFIVLGQCENESDIITIVNDTNIYSEIHNQCVNGSHFLCSYISKDDKVNVIVSVFGLAIYKVDLCKSSIFDNKVFCEEFMLTGEKKVINEVDIQTLHLDFCNCNEFDFGGVTVCIPKNNDGSVSINDKIFLITFLSYIDKIETTAFNNIKLFSEILKSNYNDLLSSLIIDIKVMKRFVNDYNLLSDFKINLDNSDKEFWFKFRVLFEIGFKYVEKIDNILLNNMIKNIIAVKGNECRITDEVTNELKRYILDRDDYFKIIIKGAQKIVSS